MWRRSWPHLCAVGLGFRRSTNFAKGGTSPANRTSLYECWLFGQHKEVLHRLSNRLYGERSGDGSSTVRCCSCTPTRTKLWRLTLLVIGLAAETHRQLFIHTARLQADTSLQNSHRRQDRAAILAAIIRRRCYHTKRLYYHRSYLPTKKFDPLSFLIRALRSSYSITWEGERGLFEILRQSLNLSNLLAELLEQAMYLSAALEGMVMLEHYLPYPQLRATLQSRCFFTAAYPEEPRSTLPKRLSL